MKKLLRVFLCVLICMFPVSVSAGTLNGYATTERDVPAVTGCWVSFFPNGVPLTHVPESNGSSNGTVWLNATNTAFSTTVKFTTKFLTPGTPVKKNVTQFSNVAGGITTPFAFPFWGGNPHHGSALLVVKDSVNKCIYPFTVGGSAVESQATMPIADNSTTDSALNVGGIDGFVQDVNVTVALDHLWDGDVDIFLISPTGIFVNLSDDNGGSGDDYGNSSFARTIFDDDAPASIVGQTPPFTGVFRPEQPLSTYNGLSGAGVNGVWTLRIVDDVAGFAGYILGWSLIIKD